MLLSEWADLQGLDGGGCPANAGITFISIIRGQMRILGQHHHEV